MISTRWLEKRKPYWSKLEALLNQSAQSGLKSLSRSELQELSLLYRQTAADLAAIREDPRFRALRSLRQPVAGARPQYHLFRSQGESYGDIFIFLENLPGDLPAESEALPVGGSYFSGCRGRWARS